MFQYARLLHANYLHRLFMYTHKNSFFILYVSMFLSSISVDTEVVKTHETRKCYTKKT